MLDVRSPGNHARFNRMMATLSLMAATVVLGVLTAMCAPNVPDGPPARSGEPGSAAIVDYTIDSLTSRRLLLEGANLVIAP